jgi:hypothetical protein
MENYNLVLLLLITLTIILLCTTKKENFENWERSYKGWWQEVVDGSNVPNLYKKDSKKWIWPY